MQLIVEPPGRRQIQLATAAAVTLVVLAAAVVPFGKLSGPFCPQLALGFGIAEVMAYVSTSVLLLSEAAILRSANYARLGAAYLFAASMFIPAAALAPDPYEARGASHGTWLLLFLDGGFALLSLLYVLRANGDAQVSPQIGRHIGGALLLALLGCGLSWFLAVLIHGIAGIRWRVSHNTLIVFKDWVSRPTYSSNHVSHTRHVGQYAAAVQFPSRRAQENHCCVRRWTHYL